MKKYDTLADRITGRRAELGLSQTDLAYAVGVTLPAVMQWESGQVKSLKAVTLMALSDALNVTPQWLASGLGEMDAGPDRAAFKRALAHRDAAPSERARLSWERIAASFARAALTPVWAALLAIPLIFAAPNSDASTSHNASIRSASGLYTHCMRMLRRTWLALKARLSHTRNYGATAAK